jgi:hypothetical protein
VAQDFTIVGVRPDVLLVGGQQIQSVMTISVRTNAHGIYFEAQTLASLYKPATVNDIAHIGTQELEALFGHDGVTSVAWTQEVTDAGNLEDHILIYVQSTSGNSFGIVDVLFATVSNASTGDQIAALRASLDATEAL